MTTATKQRIAQRYSQLDLHDARRVAERWWEMLQANSAVGLFEPERDVRRAFAIIMTRIRKAPTGDYQLVNPQLRLFGEDDAA